MKETTMTDAAKAIKALKDMLEGDETTYAHRIAAAEVLLTHHIQQQGINIEWTIKDRHTKIYEAESAAKIAGGTFGEPTRDDVTQNIVDANEALGEQIDKLAKYLLKAYPKAIDRSEGAVDTAIRLLEAK